MRWMMQKKRKRTICILIFLFILSGGIWMKFNSVWEQQKESNHQNKHLGGKETMPKLNIQIGNKNFTATLYENETTREWLHLLPLTLDMNELNGNEKYDYMNHSFKTHSENVGTIQKGDFMLYGTDCLVLFYKSFSTSYSYTKLGYIDDADDLEQAGGKGKIKITFERQK